MTSQTTTNPDQKMSNQTTVPEAKASSKTQRNPVIDNFLRKYHYHDSLSLHDAVLAKLTETENAMNVLKIALCRYDEEVRQEKIPPGGMEEGVSSIPAFAEIFARLRLNPSRRLCALIDEIALNQISRPQLDKIHKAVLRASAAKPAANPKQKEE